LTASTSGEHARRGLRPGDLIGAYTLSVFASAGLIFSLYLTLLKFRSEFTCEPNLLAMCAGGCDAALSDPISAPFWDLPITVYATSSFGLLLLCTILVLLRPRATVGLVRLTVLLLTSAGVLVSALLGAYSLLHLGGLCSLCAVLYCAWIGAFLGAWMMCPEGPLRELKAHLRRDHRRGQAHLAWLMLLIQASTFFAVTAVQYTTYKHRAADAQARTAGSFLSCRERISREIPKSALRINADGTTSALAVLMVDFSCPHCRKEYEEWRSIRDAHAEHMSLAVLHLPMDQRCNNWGNERGTNNRACAAARFAECAGRLLPGRTNELLADLFALQDEGSPEAPFFRGAALRTLASKHGLEPEEVSACLSSEQSRQLIARHLAFAAHLDVHDPPTSIIARTERGLLVDGRSYLLEGGGRNPAYLESLIQSILADRRADPPDAPAKTEP